ncbi:hypothetical protein CSC2_16610 [Clostridium zeae]|uniref:DUF4825 domain-containing protein n=1 Tax=Clostridium zeae TaxID=2759022 RepID=A0ABQ1E8N0_9CLOT|nr:hypothetical protein [Clostridium zeae]GFZ31135.1 hypothetical protein CSC2_16610 [Clostridium zeae]
MNKKNVAFIIIMFLIIGFVFHNNTSEVYKINKDKISDIRYIYEIDKNKMAEFNVTSSINKDDINDIVDSLNKGVLKPDRENVGKYTKEHIELFILGDRHLGVYKQKDGRFTVMYSANPGSNDERDEKQMTIESDVLKRYFIKFKEVSKNLKSETWDINGDVLD